MEFGSIGGAVEIPGVVDGAGHLGSHGGSGTAGLLGGILVKTML
jgi:hypothetical protein